STSLYRPLGDRVRCEEALDIVDDPVALSDFDVFHMHWPEWLAGTDPHRSRQIIGNLRAAGVPILWTQHNRMPHARPDARDVYGIWAAEADGVIHHSEYGRRVMEAEYRYGDHTRHLVAPHGHWGDRYRAHRPEEGRDEAAELLGLPPAGLRLGVVGAPRPAKDVQLAIDAVHRCTRDDVQLCVWSLRDEQVPDDPRIIAEPYDMAPVEVYARRLYALDALVMPFGDGMLTTGTMADAIAVGLPTLVSPWGYLTEALGESAIPYGETAADLAACIDDLDGERLAAAAAAAVALRRPTSWGAIAEATLAFIDDLVAAH
nr:glycosyltransferase [Actinomycetota bacterium]NIS32713.1 glycosyltransferase [Actinomycetota bacterium]NIT96402.1 glycosyltransferase [Actinomycetota bacterium]NIU20113.1 glycosyltransferase [Actinomycetota bacterium]NIU67695.1 glycosyltransferase [Actinomycetota bacterium]